MKTIRPPLSTTPYIEKATTPSAYSLRPTQSPTATPRPRAVFVFGPCRCVFNKPLTSGKNANVFNSQSTSFSKTKVGTKIVTMTLITVRRELALSLSRAAVSMAVDLV